MEVEVGKWRTRGDFWEDPAGEAPGTDKGICNPELTIQKLPEGWCLLRSQATSGANLCDEIGMSCGFGRGAATVHGKGVWSARQLHQAPQPLAPAPGLDLCRRGPRVRREPGQTLGPRLPRWHLRLWGQGSFPSAVTDSRPCRRVPEAELPGPQWQGPARQPLCAPPTWPPLRPGEGWALGGQAPVASGSCDTPGHQSRRTLSGL